MKRPRHVQCSVALLAVVPSPLTPTRLNPPQRKAKGLDADGKPKPKRAPTDYNVWMKWRLAKTKREQAANPDVEDKETHKELFAHVAHEWKSLDADVRAKQSALARKELNLPAAGGSNGVFLQPEEDDEYPGATQEAEPASQKHKHRSKKEKKEKKHRKEGRSDS